MILIFSIIKVREKIEKLSIGTYLQITVNDEKTFIPYDNYVNIDIESRKIGEVLDSDAIVSDRETEFLDLSSKKVNNDLLYFLVSSANLKINHSELDQEVTVITDIDGILELPWESIFNYSTVVFRQYPKDGSITIEEDATNNLAILTSHGHLGIGNDLKPLIDKEVKSIYECIYKLNEINSSKFRIEKILLSKHTSLKSISDIDWKKFNLIHIMAHGNKYGGLELENENHEYYKIPVTIKLEEFIELLKVGRFKLIFISVCYSGGGTIRDSSNLSYQLVKNGIAHHSIGYSGAIGDQHAESFTKMFYELFCNGKSIIETYKNAITRYRRLDPTTNYIPYLYYS